MTSLNMRPCGICRGSRDRVFQATLLKKHLVSYYRCETCGFLQTEEPFWLEEAYASSINTSDTGILVRNLWVTRLASAILYAFFDKRARFLDFAGGYGILVRMMRDVGFDFYWQDPYTSNQVARGFELKSGMSSFELVTSIESFEHFVRPLDEVEKMVTHSRNILFTTLLLPTPTPHPQNWWYYGLEHGQHISFYTEKSLNHIAQKFGLRFMTAGGIHLFTEKPISAQKYAAVIKLANYGYFNWVKRHMKSLTESDMKLINEGIGILQN